MPQISVVLIEFDARDGPHLKNVKGDFPLTAAQISSIQCNSFPESIEPLKDGQHLFTFRVDQLYCYTAYFSRPNSLAPRGYTQFSIILVTSCPYSQLFLAFLESSSFLQSSQEELFELFVQFSTLWQSILFSSNQKEFDLPLFNGTVHISNATSSSQLLNLVNNSSEDFPFSSNHSFTYIPNSNFIGEDLMSSLPIEYLSRNGQSNDLTRLWEYVILGEPILVLGSTPTAASNAALAISSLNFPEPHAKVMPYISITDSRFSGIISQPQSNCIVGTSNPYAQTLAPKYNVFKVGFNDSNGFPDSASTGKRIFSRFTCSKSIDHANLNIRLAFHDNTRKLERAISTAIDSMISSNFIDLMGQKIDRLKLEQLINLNDVTLNMSTYAFTEKLINSSIFSRIFKAKLESVEAKQKMLDLQAHNLASTFGPLELKNICKMIVRQIRSSGQDVVAKHALKRQLRAIADYVDWKTPQPVV